MFVIGERLYVHPVYYVYANIAVSIFSLHAFETKHLSSSGGVRLNVIDIVWQNGFQFVFLTL